MKNYNITAPNFKDYPVLHSTEHVQIAENFYLFYQHQPYAVETNCEINFWNRGSASENKSTFGGGQHLLEHLVLMKLPEAKKQFAGSGFVGNAGTSLQRTNYYFTSFNTNFLNTLNWLIDTLDEDNITPSNIEHEKIVISEEAVRNNSQIISPGRQHILKAYPHAFNFMAPIIGMTDPKFQIALAKINGNFPDLNLVQDITKAQLDLAYTNYQTAPLYVCMRGNLEDKLPNIVKTLESSHLNTGKRDKPENIKNIKPQHVHTIGSNTQNNDILLQLQPNPINTPREEILLGLTSKAASKAFNNVMRDETAQPLTYACSSYYRHVQDYDPQFFLYAKTSQKQASIERMLNFVENIKNYIPDYYIKAAIADAGIDSIKKQGKYDFDTIIDYFVRYNGALLNTNLHRDILGGITPQDVANSITNTICPSNINGSLIEYTSNKQSKTDAQKAHETIQKHFNL